MSDTQVLLPCMHNGYHQPGQCPEANEFGEAIVLSKNDPALSVKYAEVIRRDAEGDTRPDLRAVCDQLRGINRDVTVDVANDTISPWLDVTVNARKYRLTITKEK